MDSDQASLGGRDRVDPPEPYDEQDLGEREGKEVELFREDLPRAATPLVSHINRRLGFALLLSVI
ncbi:MAG: hypothetical protein AABN33_17200 [Acidobacteriota bacterium]